MDDKKEPLGESPNIEVVKHHKDSLPSWDELKYFARKYYLVLLVVALIPVALFSLGQQLANSSSAAPRLKLGTGAKVGDQSGRACGWCPSINGYPAYYTCDKNLEECTNPSIKPTTTDGDCAGDNTCDATPIPPTSAPTNLPAATAAPPNTCNSSLPSAPACIGVSFNAIGKYGLICVPTGDGNCAAVNPTQPPPQTTNPPDVTNPPAATDVPGGGSGTCHPGEWAVGEGGKPNCQLHGCSPNESAQCKDDGSGWNCRANPALCG